jgi:hypothetical protein
MSFLPCGLTELRQNATAFVGLSLIMLGAPSLAHASELAGGRLAVVRDAETLDCPDDATLADTTLALGTPPATQAQGLEIRVVFQRDAFGFGALISTSRAPGVRELRKPGPSCAPLAEAVSVVLAVLFDLAPPGEPPVSEAPIAAPPPERAPAAPPRSEPAPQIAPVPKPRVVRGPNVFLGIGVQGVGAYGLLGAAPVGGVSGALRGGLERWELSAGALWAPNRTVAYPPGVVHVSVLAGRLGACAWLFPSRARPDVALCAGLLLGSVRGRGEGFDQDLPAASDLWFAGEAGAVARIPIASKLALRLGISVVVPSRPQRFAVVGAGMAFRSSPAAGLLEVGPELRFR